MDSVTFEVDNLLPATVYKLKVTVEVPTTDYVTSPPVEIEDAATIETYPDLPEFTLRFAGSDTVVFIWEDSKYVKTKDIELK